VAHVQVTIAGRSYRMACGDGEEKHLEDLAAALDAKIGDMRRAFGEIGDMRLQVMAALTLADELAETKTRVEALEREIAALKAVSAAADERSDKSERQLAEALVKAAEQVEILARSLGPGHAPA
jgi:cell division protein ZapA